MLGAIEMLQRGITTVQDDAFLMPYPDPADHRRGGLGLPRQRDTGLSRARPARADRGRKAAVHRRSRSTNSRIFDQPAPADAANCWSAYDHLISTWHGAADDRIRAAVSISAPQRVSLDYFAALDDLAERHGLPLYAHMLETKVQRTLITEQPRFAGRSLVQFSADCRASQSRTPT